MHEVRFEASVHILLPRDTDVSSLEFTAFLDEVEEKIKALGGETTITVARSTRTESIGKPQSVEILERGGYA